MDVHVVDPSAFTPPYDHALCTALAAEGAAVTLVTSPFRYGEVPVPDGYALDARFYRHVPEGPLRLPLKLAAHVPAMLAYRRFARTADVVHFQWLTVQPVDVHLLPRGRPLVLTAHDILPREPRPGQRRAQRRLYDRVDAVVVHSGHGLDRLTGELGLDPAKVHVIPHGMFEHLLDVEPVLPAELPADGPPVILMPGLLRAYKGLDVLYDAWRRGVPDHELWVCGMPRMELPAPPAGVRVVPRFLSDAELAAVLRRARAVVLPYREIEQSGALHAALAFRVPVVLSAVGGFSEVAGARLVPPGDAEALHAALLALPGPPAPGPSWRDAARAHLELYRQLSG